MVKSGEKGSFRSSDVTRSLSRGRNYWLSWYFLINALMGPMAIIISLVFVERRLQMLLAEKQLMVGTLSLNGAYDSLHKRIGFW